jgi:uncharacterized protein YbcI
MGEHISAIAKRIADEAVAFEMLATGHQPDSVMVTVSDKTVVVAMVSALTPAERVAAASAIGAAQVEAYHRQLFVSSSGQLRKNIERIAGIPLGAATACLDVGAGTIVEGLATGNDLEIHMFAGNARAVAANAGHQTAGGASSAMSRPQDEGRSGGGAKTHEGPSLRN